MKIGLFPPLQQPEAAQMSADWQNCFFVTFITLAEPGIPHANDHRPLDRQPLR
jgi:hypothetical protein